jgi:hypothetical protein
LFFVSSCREPASLSLRYDFIVAAAFGKPNLVALPKKSR